MNTLDVAPPGWVRHPVTVTVGALAVAGTLFGLGWTIRGDSSPPPAEGEAVSAGNSQANEVGEETTGELGSDDGTTAASTTSAASSAAPQSDETADGVSADDHTATEPTASTASSTDPQPDKEGSGMQLSWGFGIDFDSSEWRAVDRNSDFGWSSGDTVFTVGSDVVTLVMGDPRRSECENPQNLTVTRIPVDAFEDGFSFCLKTSEDGWAWMHVADYQRPSSVLADWRTTINVWYWEE